MRKYKKKKCQCTHKHLLVFRKGCYQIRLFGWQLTLDKRSKTFTERHGYSKVVCLPFGWKLKLCNTISALEDNCQCNEQVREAVSNARFLFPKDNEIPFSQDFHYGLIGVPAEIPFECDWVSSSNRISLTAPGYGSDPYGCGAIFVNFDDVEPYMIRSK